MAIFNLFPHFRNPFNSAPQFPNQAQWNASSDNDFDMASTSMTSGAGQVPKVNNHQKTAERMAEDESGFLRVDFFSDKKLNNFLFVLRTWRNVNNICCFIR